MMMPILRPVYIEDQCLTEYRKEQMAFTKMQTELQPRKVSRIWAALRKRLF
ncbi:hypothetical protein [Rhodophyticola porphyridii]|uniref:hypothetical protein n=1 Tax=Rhodophyticola porphyridii TaxID=1852017 RepID=UPI0035D0ED9E